MNKITKMFSVILALTIMVLVCTESVFASNYFRDHYSNYGIKDKDYIVGIRDKQTVENFKISLTSIPDIETVEIKTADDEIADNSDIIKTGMKIILNDTVMNAVVFADVNGDGEVDILDKVRVNASIVLGDEFEGAYLEAADINSDGMVDIIDSVLLGYHIMFFASSNPSQYGEYFTDHLIDYDEISKNLSDKIEGYNREIETYDYIDKLQLKEADLRYIVSQMVKQYNEDNELQIDNYKITDITYVAGRKNFLEEMEKYDGILNLWETFEPDATNKLYVDVGIEVSYKNSIFNDKFIWKINLVNYITDYKIQKYCFTKNEKGEIILKAIVEVMYDNGFGEIVDYELDY